jgi:hypothetical protein
VISPVLTKRALDEISARLPGATKKEARIRFVGGRIAIVSVSYSPGNSAQLREQEIQFIHSNRQWTLFWIPTPQKTQANQALEPTRGVVTPQAP